MVKKNGYIKEKSLQYYSHEYRKRKDELMSGEEMYNPIEIREFYSIMDYGFHGAKITLRRFGETDKYYPFIIDNVLHCVNPSNSWIVFGDDLVAGIYSEQRNCGKVFFSKHKCGAMEISLWGFESLEIAARNIVNIYEDINNLKGGYASNVTTKLHYQT